MKNDLVLVVVINWNGWRDTLACLQSMQGLAGPRFEVVVCDNGSTDGSEAVLREWALECFSPARERVAEIGPDARVNAIQGDAGQPARSFDRVHLMRLPENLGYAGAINRCIEWGRGTFDPGHYWILNNDVAFEPGALREVLEASRSTPDIGLCGSVLLEWDEPHQVQALGGRFNRLLAVGRHLKQAPARTRTSHEIFFDIDYPIGASMLVSRAFLDSVGPMDEGYFLYYEEVDWAQRGRERGFRPAVALRSRIRHKEGASTGSHGGLRCKSILSEHYGVVNRLRFTRRFFPAALPVVWLSLLLVAAERAAHREWQRACLVLRLMFSPGAQPPRGRVPAPAKAK